MPKSETKKFGTAECTTTVFAAMRRLTLMGRVMKGVPANAEGNANLATVIGDPVLVADLLANTFAVVVGANGQPQRLDLGRPENVDIAFDSLKDLVEMIGWVVGLNFEDFKPGGSSGASVAPAPQA